MGASAMRVCFGATVTLEGVTDVGFLLKLKMLIPWDQTIPFLSMDAAEKLAHMPRKTCEGYS